ncbi:MAG: hypothetical protein EOO45_11860 [Flavobacterium sp.]|nr:MAG: hypothetical protein EOO45_11860 [Flavobacterium sp.]
MKRLLFLLLLAACLTSFATHKFYVAVFQLEYVPEKKVVQMTSRVFIDDLEATLNKKYSKKFYFGSARELPEANEYIRKYFIEKIDIKLNGSIKEIKFLGKEVEDDILICYYTIPAEAAVKSIEVKNTTLFESFKEQQNIIHANINRNRKSLLLTNDEPKGILQF